MKTNDDRDVETLDPSDLETLRDLAHRMVDDAFDDVATLRERPVWQPMPEDVEVAFDGPVPRTGEGAEAAYRDFRDFVARSARSALCGTTASMCKAYTS
jgi:aromatic-L-amino-acid/L-tryptophan decarboxylase